MNSEAEIKIFSLKTDISDKRIPFLIVPCWYTATGKKTIPHLAQRATYDHIKKQGGKNEEVSVIWLGRDFSARDVRKIIKYYLDGSFKFLFFVCDCTERCDILMNTIRNIYSNGNITFFEATHEKNIQM